MKIDTLVIGAGFAGLSTAHHLAKSGARNVVVLEQAAELGAHASGNNAGMIRQAVADPAIAALAHESRRVMERASRGPFGSIGFRRNGSLFLAGASNAELHNIEKTLRAQRIAFRELTRVEAVRKAPHLEGAAFERALFCADDAFVDIDILLERFVRSLRRLKVPILYGYRIVRIRQKVGLFEVSAGGRRFIARRLVNAAGAWVESLGRMAGASDLPFKAYRRHLFFSGPMKTGSAQPFVWDLEHSYYFRPIDGVLMVSPCDKQTGPPNEAAARRLLDGKLKRFAPRLAAVRIRHSRAGLRTMTPDGRFVIGEDPKLKNFYWVAGLGGHGVTTSFSVGKLAADLIMHKRTDPAIRKAFSPERFVHKREPVHAS